MQATPPPTLSRAQRRDRDRKYRQRCVAKMKAMRATIATLEQALPVVLTLDADDVAWDGFLDPNAMRIRALMRQSIRLNKQAQQLQTTQNRLQSLLREHRVASRVLSGVLQANPVDDWEHDVRRWRHLTHLHYKPWTMDACQDEIDAALKEVNAFQWSPNTHATGASFLGWRFSQRVDNLRSAFQFQTAKTFRGFDIRQYVDVGWAAYTDAAVYREVIAGHRVQASLKVVQTLAPHILIVRSTERFPGMAVDAHLLNLVFRVETARGFTQCVRSICCPDLMKANEGPRDMWPSNFIWLQWEYLDGNAANAYELRMGGTLRGSDVSYAHRWMLESLGCVLRSERLGTKRQLITIA